MAYCDGKLVVESSSLRTKHHVILLRGQHWRVYRVRCVDPFRGDHRYELTPFAAYSSRARAMYRMQREERSI